MRVGIRVGICAVLIAAAVGMAALTLTGFSLRGGAAEEGYVLAASDGRVAVYEAGNRRTPIAVTDISLDTLRAADRAMLDAGLPVPDSDALLRLLEDLGS